MRKFLYIFIFLPLLGSSQGVARLDSLRQVWENSSQADTSRLKAISQLIRQAYLFNDPDSAIYYAQMQFEVAENGGHIEFMIDAINTQGIAKAINGAFGKAIDQFMNAIEMSQRTGYQKGIIKALNNMGLVYKDIGEYTKAIDCYSKLLISAEKNGDMNAMASAFNNIGLIHLVLANYDKAVEYYEKSLALKEEMGNKHGIALTLNNIGLVYFEQGLYEKAYELFNKSLELETELENKTGMHMALTNIGDVLSKQGRYDEALGYYEQSLKIIQETGDQMALASTFNKIGNIFRKKGDITKAIQYCEQGLVIAQQLGAILVIRDAAGSLWETYKELDQFSKALEMHELFTTTAASIQNETNQKKAIEQEFQYQYAIKTVADSVKYSQEKQLQQAEIEKRGAQLKAKRNQQYALYGGLFLITVFAGLMYNRFKITSRQKNEIEQASLELTEKKQEILDSITYAKRIQTAILPSYKILKEFERNAFMYYKPKDIVAGDFYWVQKVNDTVLFAAADCTGHGVPGAIVSVVCHNALNRAVKEFNLLDPGKILDKTRELVLETFELSDEEVMDGMDIALCALKENSLLYAGARNPLWVYRKGITDLEQVEVYPATKQPIGRCVRPFINYHTHELTLNQGDTFYIFSDGFPDQFGGVNGKKYKYKRFKQFLLGLAGYPPREQREMIRNEFYSWKGEREQIDDICIIGVKI